MQDTDPSEGRRSDVSSGILKSEVADTQVSPYAIDRLSQAFENSAKRWELIVYPSLFAFIILAAYGFYLVFSLAKDIHYLAISIDTNMTVMSSNMQAISDNVAQMSRNVRIMTANVESMAQNVDTLQPMLASIREMDRSMRVMTRSTAAMGQDVAIMNQSISRPLQFMNWFMPW
ncbi:MAG: DUF948 domain-containing protein [Thermochromatium sp.]